MAPGERPIEQLQRELAVYMGPHTARLSLRTFAKKQFGCEPAALPDASLPQLIRALRPLLRSMLGEADGEQLMNNLLAGFER